MNLTLQQAVIDASSKHGRNIIPPFSGLLPFYNRTFRVTFNDCLEKGSLDNPHGTYTGLFESYAARYGIPPLDVNLEDIFKGYDPDSETFAIFGAEIIIGPLARPLYYFQGVTTNEADMKNVCTECFKKRFDAIVISVNKFKGNGWMRGYDATKHGMDLTVSQILFNTSTVH